VDKDSTITSQSDGCSWPEHRQDCQCEAPASTRGKSAYFTRGFAAALADLVRAYDQPTMASEIAKRSGLTLKDFVAAGVEPFDLDELRGAME
jgi:hypothetical protein